MAVATGASRRRVTRFDTVGSARVREALVGYAFVAIPLLFFFAFFLFPIGYAFYISFYNWGILGKIEGHPVRTPWFGQSSTALESIMGLNVWTTSGTMMLFYLATLQSIPTDVYEAAAIDGTSRWRTFWKITFPLLKPGHFFVAVVSIIGALQMFDQSFIIGGASGGPNYSTLTVVLYLYNQAIGNIKFGYAAAVGVVLFLFIFTVTLIQRLLFGKAEVA